MPQRGYCLIWNVVKVGSFLNSLVSESIKLNILTYKVAMLLALAESYRTHEIFIWIFVIR